MTLDLFADDVPDPRDEILDDGAVVLHGYALAHAAALIPSPARTGPRWPIRFVRCERRRCTCRL